MDLSQIFSFRERCCLAQPLFAELCIQAARLGQQASNLLLHLSYHTCRNSTPKVKGSGFTPSVFVSGG